MTAPIPKTKSRPAIIREHVDEFLTTGQTIENIRDIWYKFKHKIEDIKHKPDKEWDDYVNGHIGEYLFKLYLKGDTGLYKRLNIITTGLSNADYENNTPIVLFSEKRTRAFERATNALLCGRYESVGQIPSFEAVNIAEYLERTALPDSNEVYIIALTDFDPAGESIYNSMAKKVEQSLALLDPYLELISYSIPYGDDYDDAITNNDAYTLGASINNKLNQVWINSGRPYGIELNVLPNKTARLEEMILDKIDPLIVEELSLVRARSFALNKLLRDDEDYQRMLKELDEKKDELELKVENLDYTFDETWGTPITITSVRKMTTLEAA